MKILFLENKKIFEKWSSKTYEYKYNKLCESDKYDVIDIDDDISKVNVSKYKWIIFGWHGIPLNKFYNEPKHIYYKKYIENLETYEEIEEKIKPLMKIKRKAIIVQDMHSCDYKNGLDNFCKYITDNKIHYIITPYLDTEQIKYIKSNCSKVFICHMPHHIDETKFKDWNLKKDFDILLFGNDHKAFYPFRHRVINLLLKNKDNIKIKHIPKPRNYFRYNPNISDAALSKFMNRSWMTLCTPSKYNFLLGKYFESCMSKSAIIGNMATDGTDVWNDNYIQIDNDMSDDEILEIISEALDDKEYLKSIQNNMLEKMEDYYLSKYADKMYDELLKTRALSKRRRK